MVNTEKIPKTSKDVVDEMQEEYYKQHKSKFPNVVNIWRIGKTEYLDSVQKEYDYEHKHKLI